MFKLQQSARRDIERVKKVLKDAANSTISLAKSKKIKDNVSDSVKL